MRIALHGLKCEPIECAIDSRAGRGAANVALAPALAAAHQSAHRSAGEMNTLAMWLDLRGGNNVGFRTAMFAMFQVRVSHVSASLGRS